MNEEDDLLEIEIDDEVESESSLPSPRFELDGVRAYYNFFHKHQDKFAGE